MLDKVYDVEKGRFKFSLIPLVIFTLIMAVVFVVGVFFGLPNVIFPSVTALLLSIVTLFHDHWILNSILSPLAFTFWIVVGVDFYNGNFVLFFAHLPTAVISTVVIFRDSSSLILMLCTSGVYAMWIFTVQNWSLLGAYSCILGSCDPVWQGIVVFAGNASVSFLVYIKGEILVKKLGKQLDCDGGICPL